MEGPDHRIMEASLEADAAEAGGNNSILGLG